MAVQIVATSAIPVINGLLFDNTGSYTLALWLILAFWTGSALLLLITPRRTYAAGAA